LPASFKHAEFDTRQAARLLPLPQYDGLELPDIVDEAVWNIDFYRRLQRPDGAVRGALNGLDVPLPGTLLA